MLVRVSTAVRKHQTKGHLGRFLSSYNASSHSVTEGSQDRSWSRAYRGAMFITALLFVACSPCFLINPRPPAQGVASSTVSWALPHQPLTKRMPAVLPTDQSYGSVFSIKILFSLWVWGQETLSVRPRSPHPHPRNLSSQLCLGEWEPGTYYVA